MRLKKYHSIFISNLLCISLVMFLSACSNNSEVNNVAKNTNTKKAVSKDLKHVHPSNPCTAALTHSHAYEDKEHQHKYDCENTNEFVKNGHIHPATGKYPKRRHVHPNGANKHSHY